MVEVDAEFVRDLFNYDPNTGEMIWVKKGPGIRRGRVVGYFDKLGYRRVKIQYKDYYVHRVIWLYMTGEWPPEVIDHIDCNKSNNSWSNLRLATKRQNFVNYSQLHRSRFKVPHRNIRLTKAGYRVVIAKKFRGVTYSTLEEAVSARGELGKSIYGEFWRSK